MIEFMKRIRKAFGRNSSKGAGEGELRPRFWERFPLDELNEREWEELCDGCGLCCLLKFEEDGKESVCWTNVACRLLDHETCRCKHYEARTEIVKDCIVLKPGEIEDVIGWMPATCAYRLRHENLPLLNWHHLLSGSRETVHEAGISIKGKAISETDIDMDELESYAVEGR